jgi:pimeloyl-ACP methyl ester carboxylesterase
MKSFVTGLLIWLMTSCSSVFFVPDRHLIRTPDMIGLQYENVSIDVEGGDRLHGWLLPGEPPVKGTIVFLHGNAQNISYHIASVHWLPRQHYNVLLYDYRGFGKSTGEPSILQSIDDFAAVMAELQQRIGEEDHRVVVLGQSLGAALAISAVAKWKSRYTFDATVLDSAFSDYRLIAKEKMAEVFWLKPFTFLVPLFIPGTPDITADIARLSPIPVLLIHGKKDQIIPWQHSKRLYAAARKPKQLWLQPDARHIAAFADKTLRKRLLDYLDSVIKTVPSAHQSQ